MKSLTSYSTVFVNKITHGKLVTVIHCQLKKSRSRFISPQWWIFTKTSQNSYYWQIRYKKLIWSLKKRALWLHCLLQRSSKGNVFVLPGTVSFKFWNVCPFKHLIRSVPLPPSLKKGKKPKKSLTKRAPKTTKSRGQAKQQTKNRTKNPLKT